MIRGVTVGKFLPFHEGHSYLIRQALAQCDELHVLVCDRQEWGIPAAIRKGWIEAIHPAAHVHIVADDIDDHDHEGWAAKTIAAIGARPDIVFTSETYGQPYAAALGCESVLVDPARTHVNISATQIRADPWANWRYMDMAVRAYFVRRIVLVGPESTGKTTLAQRLAEHYNTVWVPEYARDYSIQHKDRLAITGFQNMDYIEVAAQQNAREDTYAWRANKIMFCDTDSFAVSVWYDCHELRRNVTVEDLARDRDYTLYLLMDTDVPFEDDGVRIGRKFRDAVFERYKYKLGIWNKPYVLLSGDVQTRFTTAAGIIDSIINNTALNVPGLVRTRWQHGGSL